jgi:predicted PhzF superfamily epimerase YddE/YHI9
VFVPAAGIPEDAGTGSAAGPIGVLAHRLWSTDPTMTIRQGAEMGRPSTIEVDVSGAAPVVGGRVAPCAEGVFSV